MNVRTVFERMCRGFMTALESGAPMHPLAAVFARPAGVIALQRTAEVSEAPRSEVPVPSVEEQLRQIVDDEAARLGEGFSDAARAFSQAFRDLGPPPGTDPQPPTIPDMHS